MQTAPRRLIFIGILALGSSPCQAEPLALPPLVVSATRSEQPSITTPSSITIIHREEIQKYAPRELSEILRGRGGLQIDDLSGDGRNATIDMRGFGPTAGANTLILVDGRRLNNSSDRANPDLSSINLLQIERIEIIQGSAGILFGNQAVGGVINIITRKPEAFRADLNAAAGDYQGYRLHAAVGDRLANGLAYQLSATKEHNDNYRDNNRTGQNALNLRLDYDYRTGGVFFEHQQIRDEAETPGSLFQEEMDLDRRQSADAYQGDFSDTDTMVSRFGLYQNLSSSWHFEGEYTQRENQRDFQTSFRGFPTPVMPSTQDRTVRSFNPRLIGTYVLPGGELLVTAGADFEQTDYELETDFGLQMLDQSIDAYYLQALAPFHPAWSVTAGVRYAEVDNEISTGGPAENLDDSVSIGSLGVVFRPDDTWRLFLRADQNYRFATVDEHTNVLDPQEVGIENQTGVSYEAGVEWQTRNLRSKLLAYRLDLEDEISFDASGFINTNLDKTRRNGLILEADWALHSELQFGGSFTYIDPEITAGPFKGNRIPLVSKRSARVYGNWEFKTDWSWLTEVQIASDRVLSGDFANEFAKLDGYSIVNTSLNYASEDWRANLRINNLLNQEYSSSGAVGFVGKEAYYPAAERNLWFTLNYQYE